METLGSHTALWCEGFIGLPHFVRRYYKGFRVFVGLFLQGSIGVSSRVFGLKVFGFRNWDC